MQGDGRYNRKSSAQAAAGDRGVPLLVDAAEAVPFPSETSVSVVDRS